MNIKQRHLQEDPNIGDKVLELDNNSNVIAEYIVNDKYKKDVYPELITVTTLNHFNDWFEPGEETIKCKEELLILRA